MIASFVLKVIHIVENFKLAQFFIHTCRNCQTCRNVIAMRLCSQIMLLLCVRFHQQRDNFASHIFLVAMRDMLVKHRLCFELSRFGDRVLSHVTDSVTNNYVTLLLRLL